MWRPSRENRAVTPEPSEVTLENPGQENRTEQDEQRRNMEGRQLSGACHEREGPAGSEVRESLDDEGRKIAHPLKI